MSNMNDAEKISLNIDEYMKNLFEGEVYTSCPKERKSVEVKGVCQPCPYFGGIGIKESSDMYKDLIRGNISEEEFGVHMRDSMSNPFQTAVRCNYPIMRDCFTLNEEVG